jgi:hypothetical protein
VLLTLDRAGLRPGSSVTVSDASGLLVVSRPGGDEVEVPRRIAEHVFVTRA